MYDWFLLNRINQILIGYILAMPVALVVKI